MFILAIFFLIYNSYFMWNKSPQSELEKTFDYIFFKGMSIMIALYFMPVLKVYEKWIEKNEK